MSAILINLPLASMTWATLIESVTAAAMKLGYQFPAKSKGRMESARPGNTSTETEKDANEITEQISLEADGFWATFSRDVRGKTRLCINSGRQSEAVLRSLAEDLIRTVVQQYIYRTLLGNIRARGYVVVDEARPADQSIRLIIRQRNN